MADNDRTRGYRDNETIRRPRPSSDQPAGDPLAELARLIGQQNESDPYPQQTRAPAPQVGRPVSDQDFAAPDPYEHQPNQRAPHWRPSYAADQGGTAVVYGDSRYDPRRATGAQQAQPSAEAYSSDQAYPSDQPYSPDLDAASYADPRQATTAYPGQYDDPRYGDQPYAADPRYAEPDYDDPRYAAPRYGDQSYGAAQGYSDRGYTDQDYGDARYANGAGHGYADPRYPDPHFGAQDHAPSYPKAPDGYAPFAADQGYPAYADRAGGLPHGQPYANAHFGAPPPPAAMAEAGSGYSRAKRHGGMVTVLAVLALAVVGTAAAFGYRAVFSGAGNVAPPPVIKADVRPSKVVPATDPNNKPIQDRIGVKTEKIVPRQEEPVQQAAPGQPRVISPFLAGQNPQAFPPASANVAPTGGTAPSGAEPKRIRTVPIKPQQGSEAPAQRNTRSASPAAQQDTADQAPMALAPTGSVSPQRPGAREAHAALTPRDTGASGGSPFPTPLPGSPASAPASGPFAVQVTSQRSEADAQASFKSLQQQFPSVLGNRQPLIRRADLGDRGTYYRAQIPFSSQSAANEFCSSLKAAGGQCVVARN
jgi:hypothetical protein